MLRFLLSNFSSAGRKIPARDFILNLSTWDELRLSAFVLLTPYTLLKYSARSPCNTCGAGFRRSVIHHFIRLPIRQQNVCSFFKVAFLFGSKTLLVGSATTFLHILQISIDIPEEITHNTHCVFDRYIVNIYRKGCQ